MQSGEVNDVIVVPEKTLCNLNDFSSRLHLRVEYNWLDFLGINKIRDCNVAGVEL